MAIKSSIEAGRGHVSLSTDSSKLEAGLAAASAKLKSWGASVMTLGAGIAAGATAIVAPFLQGLQVLSDFGNEAFVAMRMTGMAFDEMDTLMDGMRVGAEQFVPAVAKMSAFIVEAGEGSRQASQAMDALGLSMDELSGMSQGDRMMRIADALSGIADAGRRIQLQREIFGRGGLSLDLRGGAAGIRERAERADRLNPESAGDVALARAYNAAMRDMKMSIQGVWMEVGRAAVPLMTEFAKFLTEIIVRVRMWMAENRELLNILFRVVDKVVLLGGAVVGLGVFIYGLGISIGFLKTVLHLSMIAAIAKSAALVVAKAAVVAYSAVVSACSFVVGLFTGVTWGAIAAMAAFAVGAAALVGIGYLLFQSWDSFVEFMSAWGPALQAFGAIAMQVFRGIGDAILTNNWVLAMQIAWAGIKLVWTQGVNFLKGGWEDFTFVMQNLFLDVCDKISVAFAQMVNFAIRGINNVIAAYNSVRPAFAPAVDELSEMDEQATVRRNMQIRNVLAGDRAGNRAVRDADERRLERELEGLTMRAWFDRMAAEVERQMEVGGGGGGGLGDLAEGKFKVAGGFSAGAIFGALGQSEGPMARLVREAERARQQRQEHLDRLDDVLDILPDLGVRVA